MGKDTNPRRVAENEAMAKLRMLRTSPQKLNLVAAMIRGKKVDKALTDLTFSKKRIAIDVKKCLQSAIANAENNHNLDVDELIVADYKSQQSNYGVSQSTYFNSPYKDGYKKQLDFYAYLLKEMGFKVSNDSYLYICNAINENKGFNGKMIFDEVLIHYKVDTSYLDNQIQNMIDVLNSIKPPQSNESCENCAYANKRSELNL